MAFACLAAALAQTSLSFWSWRTEDVAAGWRRTADAFVAEAAEHLRCPGAPRPA